MNFITPKLIEKILQEYALPWRGTHGITHWARVLENARGLAQLTGADMQVVELFAVFHDSRRPQRGSGSRARQARGAVGA